MRLVLRAERWIVLALFGIGTVAFGAMVVAASYSHVSSGKAAPTEEWIEAAARANGPSTDEAAWSGPVASFQAVAGGQSIRPSIIGSRSKFVLPLRKWTFISDPFGVPRDGGKIHGGIDLALGADLVHSPVYAACNGMVLSSDYSDDYGNHVVVDCGEGWSTLYAHFSELLVEPGMSVVGGATILGRSGTTGFSTGEHLHFEVRWQGVPIDPEEVLDFGRGIRTSAN
jgi:murein DD-endopeptidase MepM/ murein hydrolase activator NlpD